MCLWIVGPVYTSHGFTTVYELPDLFEALELLRRVDGLLALGTLLAHLDSSGLSRPQRTGRGRRITTSSGTFLPPTSLHSLLSICCVSPGLPSQGNEGRQFHKGLSTRQV